MEKQIKDKIDLTKVDSISIGSAVELDDVEDVSEFLKHDESTEDISDLDDRPVSVTSTSSDESNISDSVIFDHPGLKPNNIDYLLPVAIAESVTAGALANTLCSEPGSSKFFLGGIVAYNMKSQEKLLHIDAAYAELNNFANTFTTFDMAKNVSSIFGSRIGLSTTGYSLPLYRPENKEEGKCEINIQIPYAYLCLYDAQTEYHKIHKITNDEYDATASKKMQRAKMQVKVALYGKKIYEDYCARFISS
jgi:PncC family amidohydrolase